MSLDPMIAFHQNIPMPQVTTPEQDLRLQAMKQQASDAQGARQAFQGAWKNPMPTAPSGNQAQDIAQMAMDSQRPQVFNREAYLQGIAKIGNPDLFAAAQQHIAAQDAAQVAAKKAALEAQQSQHTYIMKLLGSAIDQPTWDQALTAAKGIGVDVSAIPPQFDPATKAKLQDAALSEDSRIKLQMKQMEIQAAKDKQENAGPSSAIGKIRSDLAAGTITQTDADKAIAKETHIAPGVMVQVGGGEPSADPAKRSSRALQLANGEIAPVKPTRGDPTALRDMADARQIMTERGQDPNDLPGLYEGKRKGQTSWASGQTNAKTVTALNTAVDHMGVLESAAKALKNGDWQTGNKIANAIGVNMGANEKTNFDAVATFLAGEIEKVISGGNPTIEGTRNARAMFPAEGSNAQIFGAIEKARQILGGKVNALNLEHQGAFNGASLTDRKRLTPATVAAFQGVLQSHGEAPPTSGQGSDPGQSTPDMATLGKNPRFPTAVWVGKSAPGGAGWYVKEAGKIRRVE
jgi:hypothetical protein